MSDESWLPPMLKDEIVVVHGEQSREVFWREAMLSFCLLVPLFVVFKLYVRTDPTFSTPGLIGSSIGVVLIWAFRKGNQRFAVTTKRLLVEEHTSISLPNIVTVRRILSTIWVRSKNGHKAKLMYVADAKRVKLLLEGHKA